MIKILEIREIRRVEDGDNIWIEFYVRFEYNGRKGYHYPKIKKKFLDEVGVAKFKMMLRDTCRKWAELYPPPGMRHGKRI